MDDSTSVSTVETIRAVFIIDDKKVIRAIIYYPLTTGRSMGYKNK